MIDLHELYWAAGFLEGEGSFGSHKQQSKKRTHIWYKVNIQCGQVQEEPLKRLQKLFGGKIYFVKGKQKNHNDSFLWQIWGGNAAGLMMTLWTLMSPKRKIQIQEALFKWKSNKTYSEAALQRGQLRNEVLYVQ